MHSPPRSGRGVVSSPLVAVVDDDVETSRATASLLQGAGFAVVCFPDGPPFLDACERLRPDAVVLDLAMPRMSGVEVLRHLRKERESTLPVVVVSGQAEGAALHEVRRLGVAATLRKPVESEELEDVLRAVVGSERVSPTSSAPGEPAQPRAAKPRS